MICPMWLHSSVSFQSTNRGPWQQLETWISPLDRFVYTAGASTCLHEIACQEIDTTQLYFLPISCWLVVNRKHVYP